MKTRKLTEKKKPNFNDAFWDSLMELGWYDVIEVLLKNYAKKLSGEESFRMLCIAEDSIFKLAKEGNVNAVKSLYEHYFGSRKFETMKVSLDEALADEKKRLALTNLLGKYYEKSLAKRSGRCNPVVVGNGGINEIYQN